MITLSEFIKKYSGKKIDFDGAYNGQCVDLFRQYNQEVLEINQPKGVVGAADFWTNYDTDLNLKNNFDKIPNSASFKPKAGDVMIWNKKAGGGFGHVGVVSDDKATLDKFWSFDQNWRAINVCEITEHNYTNVYGVLRPKKTTPTPPVSDDTIPVKKSDFENLVTKATWYDANKAEFEVLRGVKTEFDQFRETMNKKLDTLARNLSTIIDWDAVESASARFKGMDEKNLELQDRLERENRDHKKEIDEYEDRLQVLRNELAEMKLEHSKEIDVVTKRVDKEIEELQKAKQQYEATSKLIKWVKNLFGKK